MKALKKSGSGWNAIDARVHRKLKLHTDQMYYFKKSSVF